MIVSSLCHSLEHIGGDSILHAMSAEEAFEIIHDYFGDLVPDSAPAAGHVGGDDGPRQGPQGMSNWKRFQRVSDIESAA